MDDANIDQSDLPTQPDTTGLGHVAFVESHDSDNPAAHVPQDAVSASIDPNAEFQIELARPSPPPPPGISYSDALKYCGLLITVQFAAGIALTPLLIARGWKRGDHSLLALVVGDIVMFVLAARLLKGDRLRAIDVGWRAPRLRELVWTIAAVLPLFVVHTAVSTWFAAARALPDSIVYFVARSFIDRLFSHIEKSLLAIAEQPWAVVLLVGCLLPALAEETFFRMVLGQGLVRRYGAFRGVLVTSLLFGASHIWPPQACFAFFFGMALHWLFLTTRSIGLSMLLHALNNLVVFATIKGAQAGYGLSGQDGEIDIPLLLFCTALAASAALVWSLHRGRQQEPSTRGLSVPQPCGDLLFDDNQSSVALGGSRRPWRTATLASLAFAAMFILAGRHWIANILVNRASELYEAAQYDAALASVNRAIEWDAGSAWAWRTRAIVHADLGSPELALADAEKAVQLAADDSFAYMVRGWLQLRQACPEKAIADCGRAIKLDPGNAEAYRIRAFALNDLGRFDEALMDCADAIRLAPDDLDAFRARAFAYQSLGKNRQAIADYTTAIKLSPGDDELYVARGMVEEAEDDPQKALADFSRAIELDPKNAEAFRNRAVVLADLGRSDDALLDSLEAVRIAPDDPHIFRARALAYQSQGRNEQAIAELTKAIELSPDDAELYVARGVVEEELADHEEALADYGRAISLAPKHGGAYHARAIALNNTDRYHEALADCGTAMALLPEEADVFRVRAYTYHALGEYDKAIDDCTRALAIDPALWMALQYRGRAFAARGDFETAIADYSAALAVEESAEVLIDRALLWHEGGQPDRARTDLDRALVLEPNHARAKALRAQLEQLSPDTLIPP